MSNEVMNELIIKLSKLNNKLNLDNENSNVKLVFAGIKDDRDPIIDRILTDEIIDKKFQKQSKLMNKYYSELYGNNIDFTGIVDNLLRIILKNFKLFDDINSPKGNLISYCFNQKIGSFENRVRAYFNRYYKELDEMKGHKSLDQMLEKQRYDMYDVDYFESNKFYIDFYESGANSRYDRGNDNSDNIEEEELWYSKDDDTLPIPVIESYPTIENAITTNYDIPHQKLRVSNIVWSDQQYNEEIDKIRDKKIKKWHKYRDESGYLPHDIKRYRVGGNYFKVRDNTKPDYIYVVCRPKEFDFEAIFFDKTIESYLRNIMIKNLSERQQLLIGYLYYQMMSVDDVVSLMGFSSRTVLNQEKSRCLREIRIQILKDYEFILEEYNGTPLAYWIKKIKQKEEGYAKKDKKMLSI